MEPNKIVQIVLDPKAREILEACNRTTENQVGWFVEPPKTCVGWFTEPTDPTLD